MLTLAMPSVNYQTVTRPAGTVLHRRDCTPEAVHYLLRGRTAVGLLDDKGRLAHQLGWMEDRGWLNLGCAVLGRTPVLDMVAETTVELQLVPRQEFRDALDDLPQATRALLLDLAHANVQQAQMAISRLGKDAEARLAEWLLAQAQPAQDLSSRLVVLLTERKRNIAAQLGIAPETLSRMLRQLRERQLISGKGRQLNLININALQALAAG